MANSNMRLLLRNADVFKKIQEFRYNDIIPKFKLDGHLMTMKCNIAFVMDQDPLLCHVFS